MVFVYKKCYNVVWGINYVYRSVKNGIGCNECCSYMGMMVI